jgi:flagellar hook assembly protein FlgD
MTAVGAFIADINPLTTISYAVSTLARVRVVVYNLLGQEVVVLVNDIEEAGYKRVVWRGVDARNAAVPSGVYFCRMTAQEITTGASLHTSVRKMAVVK